MDTRTFDVPEGKKVELTPWWVRFFIRIVDTVINTDKFDSISEKDRIAFTTNLRKLNDYLTFRGK